MEPNEKDDLIDEVEIEAYGTRGEKVPRARRYTIRIDKTRYTVSVPGMTGAEILKLADKDPARTLLQERVHGGGTKTIAPDEFVDFTAPGVERFMTLPKGQTDGDGATRRQFRLRSDDERYLDSTGLEWETLAENGQQWLLVRGWPVPAGYDRAVVDVALMLPPAYPDVQIDMVYFHPPLSCGKTIAAVTAQPIDGRSFQRWSRHRTEAAPWRAGLDDIASHLVLVDYWLHRELGK